MPPHYFAKPQFSEIMGKNSPNKAVPPKISIIPQFSNFFKPSRFFFISYSYLSILILIFFYSYLSISYFKFYLFFYLFFIFPLLFFKFIIFIIFRI